MPASRGVDRNSGHDAQLVVLSQALARRRAALLQAWRAAVSADASLTSGASLPRAQLQDHIPALLVDYERRLAAGEAQPAAAGSVQTDDAAAHGLHRWQQGFGLAEVTRELGRLNECVVAELERYAAAHAEIGVTAMGIARRLWAQQYGDAIGASTSEYFRLKQVEAGSHIKDLEDALGALRELERQRAQLWQQAAHDLRGNLGVVANASVGLASAGTTDELRERFLRLLDRNVGALHHLLDDVTSLARLQAGQERRRIERMDVSPLLQDLCEGLQPQARQRDLYLEFSGPGAMPVEGDAVKTRRIAQNLVLNAIKYTRQGGITVSWGACDDQDTRRWFLQVRDSGPGFHAGPGSPLAGALETATDQAKQLIADASEGEISHIDSDPAQGGRSPVDHRPVSQAPGEGLGLSIVKRLCELLDATVELESVADHGTTFRVLLPQRYGD